MIYHKIIVRCTYLDTLIELYRVHSQRAEFVKEYLYKYGLVVMERVN